MAAALIALILLILLRSLLAPVVLMISVGLGFAATLGAAALFFQHVLDKPGVNFVLPLVLFLFVVALGTDYNILISDRMREEMERPGPAGPPSRARCGTQRRPSRRPASCSRPRSAASRSPLRRPRSRSVSRPVSVSSSPRSSCR